MAAVSASAAQRVARGGRLASVKDAGWLGMVTVMGGSVEADAQAGEAPLARAAGDASTGSVKKPGHV